MDDEGCHLYSQDDDCFAVSFVHAGDMLVMEMTLVSFDERLGFATMTGKAYVGGRVSERQQ